VPVLPIVPERKKVSVLPGYVLCQERISRLPERAVIPRQVNHLQSIAGAHAAQHSVDVILDGLLGEVQVRSDLFIRQSLRNQGNQLLLPAS